MRMFRSLLILIAVSAIGCAGSQPVRLQLPPSARIGILNVLGSQMTHIHVGTFRFGSFTNLYDVDWDIPAFMNRTIENDLKARGSYTFIPLALNASADWKQSTASSILSAVNAWMPRDLRTFLQQAAEQYRLDAIISVSSYNSAMWQENACFKIGKGVVGMDGYGLFTRTRALSGISNLVPVGQNQATPYANIIVAVFKAQPANLAAYAEAPCTQPELPDFAWGSDLQFLDPAVLKQVRPYVERLSAEAAQTALTNAGLLP